MPLRAFDTFQIFEELSKRRKEGDSANPLRRGGKPTFGVLARAPRRHRESGHPRENQGRSPSERDAKGRLPEVRHRRKTEANDPRKPTFAKAFWQYDRIEAVGSPTHSCQSPD